MTTSNSEHGVGLQDEIGVAGQRVDGELLRLIDRILALEGQRIRLLRELIERQSHYPDSQILHLCFRPEMGFAV